MRSKKTTKTTKSSGKIKDLAAKDTEHVQGGGTATAKPVQYLQYKLTDALISGFQPSA
jgi:hypothetical protein